MEDIFNQDKFLLIGGKGTGKTAFYQALRELKFFTSLQQKSQKGNMKCKVINIISLPNEPESIKFIDVATRFPHSTIKDPDFFYRRFWEVFIWNAIRLDDKKPGFKSTSNLVVKPIRDDDTTAHYLHKYIIDEIFFNAYCLSSENVMPEVFTQA
jgi:hypothetical protein